MVVNFTSTKLKDSVLSAAYKLKDTSYSISKNVSPGVQEVPRKLLAFPKAQDAKFKLCFNMLLFGDKAYTHLTLLPSLFLPQTNS